MVVALGVLYSALFKMELHDYLPYLALSLVLWNIPAWPWSAEACTCFTAGRGHHPVHAHALHAVRRCGSLVRNLLILAHNVGRHRGRLRLVRHLARRRRPRRHPWPRCSGSSDGVAACLLLGAFCARFRDIPPIVASVMQIAFFVSPIIWKPELLKGTALELLWLNPFFTLLEIVRGPMLGEMPSRPRLGVRPRLQRWS